MKKGDVKLSEVDRQYLQELVHQNKVSVQVWRRATGLLKLNQGESLQSVASALRVHYLTVADWRNRYKEAGLALLQNKPRSGRPPQIDGVQRAKITALACSLPEGYKRWSVRLLATKVVELGYIESISRDKVHQILKKTN